MFSEYPRRLMSFLRRHWRAALAVIVLLLILRNCVFKGAGVKPGVLPASVITGQVTSRDMPFELVAIGSVEASSSVAVNTQVSGILKEAHFREGDFVEAGGLLFTIDPAPYEAALREKEGNLAMQKARALNAETELKRNEELRRRDFVTQSQLDQARADANSFSAAVRAAEAAAENARLQLGYTRISAPISGRSGDLLVKPGNLLKANEAASVMVRINQIQPVFVRFSLPEQYLARITEEMRKAPLIVKAGTRGDASRVFEGRVTFIDNAVDSKTGTILLKATFPNEEELLWPGQFLDVRLVLFIKEDALVVPSAAIMTGQQGQYVFVVNADNRVELKTLEVLYANGADTIVKDQLRPGDEVVTDGQMGLAGGSVIVRKGAQSR